jgi:hypothetical protein
MKVKFLRDGESPVRGVGVFSAGTVLDIPDDVAREFIRMKLAVEAARKTTGKKEVKKDGRD